MTTPPRRRPRLRPLAITTAIVATVAGGAAVSGVGAPGSATADVASDRAKAQTLRQQMAAESRRIASTAAGLEAAQARLSRLEARAQERQGQLDDTQDKLVEARIHLSRLEKKAARATSTLSANLRSAYEGGRPDLVSLVLTSQGFSELLDRVDFLKSVSVQNAQILDTTRDAKTAVAHQTQDLTKMRATYSALAASAVKDRNEAAVVRGALLTRKAAQLERRKGTSAALGRVQSRIRRIERQQAAAARAARAQAAATAEAPSPASGGGGSSSPGGGGSSSPAAPSSSGGGDVAKVVAAANQIATTPYVWGGGHGGAGASGYDCSGSISYALAAAGLIDAPMASGGFMSWGEPGPGKRITVYANAGHAYMVVDGRRFDTSALSQGGTRWTSESRSNAGFVARHPPGL